MKRASFFLAAALLILILATVGYSFEIAIYSDPLSAWLGDYLDSHRHYGYNGTWQAYIAPYYRTSQMDSVYEWYRDMGVTKVMVNYIDPDNFDWIRNDSTHIKVMNWFYPGDSSMYGEKYADAQFRDVQVGYDQQALPPNDPRGYWSYHDAIGNGATRTTYDPPSQQAESRPVLTDTTGLAGTLWRPTSELGAFSGWDWYTTGWLDSSIYMPMHFRLTWAVDPNDSVQVTTSTVFADFYWMVQAPNETIDGVPHTRWWQFPYKSLTLDSLPDTTSWITSVFTDSALTGTYHLLDENFAVLDTAPPSLIHFGPAHPPHSLDNIYLTGLAYGLGTQVRMAVQYQGNHNFYLNRIEVYDEGAWRMFAKGA